MNSVRFKKINIRNFLSIGDEPVNVTFKSGLNIITGNNRDKEDRRNGVGKSSIADAINFAIFGNTIRDIKRENVGNDCTGKQCEVVLDFDVVAVNSKKEYKIVRTLNPSKVNIFIDGEDKTLDTIENNNAFIAKLLNSNQEVFDNCVIMTLNNTLPFMGKKKQDKRKFIESIFDLEIFSKMLTDAKTQYSDRKREFDIQSGKKTEVENNLNTLKTQFNGFNEKKKERADALRVRLTDAVSQLEKLKSLRAKRDNKKVEELLMKIKSTAFTNENLMPHVIEAVEAYATLGEIAHTLRSVFGEYGK